MNKYDVDDNENALQEALAGLTEPRYPNTMKEVEYQCASCGATDKGRFFPHEPAFPAISCYKCHAGQGKDYGTMAREQVGMFPTGSPVDVP